MGLPFLASRRNKPLPVSRRAGGDRLDLVEPKEKDIVSDCKMSPPMYLLRSSQHAETGDECIRHAGGFPYSR
jgi:hypothetical protein